MSATPIPWEGFDPSRYTRYAAACRQIGELLSDGEWHRWRDVADPVAASTNLLPRTVDSVLRQMVRNTGTVERRGRVPKGRQPPRRDRRMVRLADSTASQDSSQ
jgi:hypothetical protein